MAETYLKIRWCQSVAFFILIIFSTFIFLVDSSHDGFSSQHFKGEPVPVPNNKGQSCPILKPSNFSKIGNSKSPSYVQLSKLISDGYKNFHPDRNIQNAVFIIAINKAETVQIGSLLAANAEELEAVQLETGNLLIVNRGNTDVLFKSYVPNIVVNVKKHQAFYSLRSPIENFATAKNIASAYFLAKIIEQVERYKILLTVPITLISNSSHWNELDYFFKHVVTLQVSLETLNNSIGLVVTDAATSYINADLYKTDTGILKEIHWNLEIYLEYLQNTISFSNAGNYEKRILRKMMYLVMILINNHEKVWFLRKPPVCGSLNNTPIFVPDFRNKVTNLCENQLEWANETIEIFNASMRSSVIQEIGTVILPNVLESLYGNRSRSTTVFNEYVNQFNEYFKNPQTMLAVRAVEKLNFDTDRFERYTAEIINIADLNARGVLESLFMTKANNLDTEYHGVCLGYLKVINFLRRNAISGFGEIPKKSNDVTMFYRTHVLLQELRNTTILYVRTEVLSNLENAISNETSYLLHKFQQEYQYQVLSSGLYSPTYFKTMGIFNIEQLLKSVKGYHTSGANATTVSRIFKDVFTSLFGGASHTQEIDRLAELENVYLSYSGLLNLVSVLPVDVAATLNTICDKLEHLVHLNEIANLVRNLDFKQATRELRKIDNYTFYVPQITRLVFNGKVNNTKVVAEWLNNSVELTPNASVGCATQLYGLYTLMDLFVEYKKTNDFEIAWLDTVHPDCSNVINTLNFTTKLEFHSQNLTRNSVSLVKHGNYKNLIRVFCSEYSEANAKLLAKFVTQAVKYSNDNFDGVAKFVSNITLARYALSGWNALVNTDLLNLRHNEDIVRLAHTIAQDKIQREILFIDLKDGYSDVLSRFPLEAVAFASGETCAVQNVFTNEYLYIPTKTERDCSGSLYTRNRTDRFSENLWNVQPNYHFNKFSGISLMFSPQAHKNYHCKTICLDKENSTVTVCDQVLRSKLDILNWEIWWPTKQQTKQMLKHETNNHWIFQMYIFNERKRHFLYADENHVVSVNESIARSPQSLWQLVCLNPDELARYIRDHKFSKANRILQRVPNYAIYIPEIVQLTFAGNVSYTKVISKWLGMDVEIMGCGFQLSGLYVLLDLFVHFEFTSSFGIGWIDTVNAKCLQNRHAVDLIGRIGHYAYNLTMHLVLLIEKEQNNSCNLARVFWETEYSEFKTKLLTNAVTIALARNFSNLQKIQDSLYCLRSLSYTLPSISVLVNATLPSGSNNEILRLAMWINDVKRINWDQANAATDKTFLELFHQFPIEVIVLLGFEPCALQNVGTEEYLILPIEASRKCSGGLHAKSSINMLEQGNWKFSGVYCHRNEYCVGSIISNGKAKHDCTTLCLHENETDGQLIATLCQSERSMKHKWKIIWHSQDSRNHSELDTKERWIFQLSSNTNASSGVVPNGFLYVIPNTEDKKGSRVVYGNQSAMSFWRIKHQGFLYSNSFQYYP